MTTLTEWLRRGEVDRAYELVKATARRILFRKGGNGSLTATELTHESYLRQMRQKLPHIKNRQHYAAMVAHIMQQILVDDARNRLAQKRNGIAPAPAAAAQPEDILAVTQAMTRLRRLDSNCAKVVELRYIVGLSVEETAAMLGRETWQVADDWAFAKVWLRDQLDSSKSANRSPKAAISAGRANGSNAKAGAR
ncbi:MAG: ECF-type sigma factor [Bryobacteraceae bacterium]|nr:ECF-type sigma factor [Bryobacteraceae bacterium]